MPAMFFAVDENGIVRGVNRVAIESLGYSEEELVGHNVMVVVHPLDHAEVAGRLAACFADPSATHTFSFRKIRKDGTMMWVKEVTRVVDGPDGAARTASGLTPTEQTIGALAAQGLTNREIADRMFLSPKTVEVNLTRIYRKVGVRSRAALASRFARDGQPWGKP